MKYEFLIGRRYLRASRGNRFVSFISTISMAGLAIGVAVLIVVLSVMNGFEREVRDRSGHWYSLRIRPYKNVDNKIDGAVLTLFDVDVPKRSEQRVRLAKEYTDALMRTIDQSVVVLDANLRVQMASERFARSLGKAPTAIVGQHLDELDGTWNLTSLHERIHSSAVSSKSFERVPVEVTSAGSARRTVWVTGRWLPWHESPDTQILLLAMSSEAMTPGADT